MIIRKTNKQTAVWALLTLVLTAVLLTGCEAPQAGPAYSCTVSISCASILEHMDLCSPDKADLVPEDGCWSRWKSPFRQARVPLTFCSRSAGIKNSIWSFPTHRSITLLT